MKTYLFFEDAGHGWLRVKREELKQLNIETLITGFSYMKNDYIYLEEDQDMSTFLDAKFSNEDEIRNFLKNNIITKLSKDQSTIRNYDNYRVLTETAIIRYNKIRNYMLSKFNSKKNKNKIKKATLSNLEYWNTYYNLNY